MSMIMFLCNVNVTLQAMYIHMQIPFFPFFPFFLFLLPASSFLLLRLQRPDEHKPVAKREKGKDKYQCTCNVQSHADPRNWCGVLSVYNSEDCSDLLSISLWPKGKRERINMNPKI